ncbi:hypothetical protein [Streptomyces sp. KLOTTS4A1]|uniref:hypothetical protein n=1 Tax=Streptomyces sp. KLOTTS4A1 TaxID=3390996 RepID=UPI0039F453BF
MHGPGYAPPPPSRPSDAALVALRVVFVALAVASFGFLAWAPLLRLAIVTRKPRDWWLFGASLVAVALSIALIGSEPTDDLDTAQEAIGLILLLGSLIGGITYYLYADIKHFHSWSGPAALGHHQPVGYGYHPGAPTPYGRSAAHPGITAPMHRPLTQQPAAPQPPAAPQSPGGPHSVQQPVPNQHHQHQQHQQHQSITQHPIPTPPPAPQPPAPQPPAGRRPAPARIDQVRAELDELSSFLRGNDDTTNGHSGRDFPPRERHPEDNR